MTRSAGLSEFFKKALSIFLLLYLLFTPVTFFFAAEKPVPKRVLAIFTFKQRLPWTYQIEESLWAAITADLSKASCCSSFVKKLFDKITPIKYS